MHKGKKYVDSAKTIDRTKQYDPAEALSTVVSTAKAKFDETIELRLISVWALTPVTLTSRFAALSFCPTALASRFALLYSLRAQRLTRLWLQAQTSLVQRT